MTCSKSDSDSIEKCAALLRQGAVLILPTDTVYGFSGIIEKTDARIRAIKGRAETKPFIVLVSEPGDLRFLTNDCVPETLLGFWPGPLTLIVHKKENPAETVAVRCPGDEWLRAVIRAAGAPVYSTSVNRSGSPVLTKIRDIRAEFEAEVSLIVDDGDSGSSVPSTIVRLEERGWSVVRAGAVEVPAYF